MCFFLMNSAYFSKRLHVVRVAQGLHGRQQLISAFAEYLDEVYQGIFTGGRSLYAQIEQTQDEPQWIVAQRLLSALTIPGFK